MRLEMPGTNIVLVMTSSDRSCLQLRQYLTTMMKTDPPFGPNAGKKMMETLFLSNWSFENNRVSLDAYTRDDRDEVRVKYGDMEKERNIGAERTIPKSWQHDKTRTYYKRRRMRGGANAPARQTAAEREL